MTTEEILAALTAIIDAAEGRELTDEEVARYEELEGKMTTAKKTAEIRSRNAAYNTVQPAVHVAAEKKDDTLERAFNHFMRTGKENQDIVELRAQSVGTTTAGGFTVPEAFRNKLVDRLKAYGGIAPEVETITTESGAPMPFPTLDDTANSGEIAAEGSNGVAGADLVFGEKTLGAFKYVAPGADNSGDDPLRVSVELLQDSAFDIEALVIRKLGERIARKQAVDWVRGAGTTAPFGVTTSSGPSKTFAGASPTKDELIDALHSVDPAYRMNGVWAFNDATLAKIRKLQDSQGRPLWLPLEAAGLENVPGGTLLGHRVVIDQAFLDSTDASSNKWGVFGDLREGYVIRRVRDVQVIVDPYTRANQGQVTYTLWARADGLVQNPNSYAVLLNDAA